MPAVAAAEVLGSTLEEQDPSAVPAGLDGGTEGGVAATGNQYVDGPLRAVNFVSPQDLVDDTVGAGFTSVFPGIETPALLPLVIHIGET